MKSLFYLLLAFVAVLLNVYVIWSVSEMFNITVLLDLGYRQIFGLYLIVTLLKLKSKDIDLDDSDDTALLIGRLAYMELIILMGWGISYLYSLIKF